MKKLPIMVLNLSTFYLFGALGTVIAAEQSVTVSPAGIGLGLINGEYEKKNSENTSMIIRGESFALAYDDVSLSAFGCGVGLRKYISGKVLRGFYLGESADLTAVSVSDYYDKAGMTIIGVTGESGYKWSLTNGFTFDFGATVGIPLYGAASFDGDVITATFPALIGTGLKLNLGYSW